MSDTPSTALATRAEHAGTKFRLLPSSLGEAQEMARLIAGSDLCPKAYRGKPADCIVAYDYGAALGFSWMQSLRAVAVVNGTPSIFGDAVPALILGSRECERFHEVFEGKAFEDTYKAVCIIRRKGLPDEIKREFSVADAKTAKIWQKRGRDGQDTPWITYPGRMLQMRARGFAARDAFPDKLSGLVLFEEAMDYPDAIDTQVVSSEIVDPLERIPDGVRDNLGKAFEALNLSTAQRLAKINEFLGKDGVTADDGATALLEWCRDEYAKRKTGQPRKESNDKPRPTPASPQPSPVPAGDSVSASRDEPHETSQHRPSAAGDGAAAQSVSESDINFRSGPPPVQPLGELF